MSQIDRSIDRERVILTESNAPYLAQTRTAPVLRPAAGIATHFMRVDPDDKVEFWWRYRDEDFVRGEIPGPSGGSYSSVFGRIDINGLQVWAAPWESGALGADSSWNVYAPGSSQTIRAWDDDAVELWSEDEEFDYENRDIVVVFDDQFVIFGGMVDVPSSFDDDFIGLQAHRISDGTLEDTQTFELEEDFDFPPPDTDFRSATDHDSLVFLAPRSPVDFHSQADPATLLAIRVEVDEGDFSFIEEDHDGDPPEPFAWASDDIDEPWDLAYLDGHVYVVGTADGSGTNLWKLDKDDGQIVASTSVAGERRLDRIWAHGGDIWVSSSVSSGPRWENGVFRLDQSLTELWHWPWYGDGPFEMFVHPTNGQVYTFMAGSPRAGWLWQV